MSTLITRRSNSLWWTMIHELCPPIGSSASRPQRLEAPLVKEIPDESISTSKSLVTSSSEQLPSLVSSDWDLLDESDSSSDCVLEDSSKTLLENDELSPHNIDSCSSPRGPATPLTICNFVEQSSAQDRMAIREIIERDNHHPCQRGIQFVDTVPGNVYRRWLYKKTGVYRQVLNVAETRGIPVQFLCTVHIDHTMSPKAIVSLLDAIRSDPDVTTLYLAVGTVTPKEAESIVMALVLLLTSDHRPWQAVHVSAHIDSPESPKQPKQSSKREAQLVQRVCQRALEKVSQEEYIPITIHLSSSS